MSFQKNPPWRCKKYRDFVASKPCCICTNHDDTIVAHHENLPGHSTMGGKSSDVLCVPACAVCHGLRDSINWMPPIWLDFDQVRYDLLNEWLNLL